MTTEEIGAPDLGNNSKQDRKYDWPSQIPASDVTIVVPSLNEEQGIGVVIKQIRAAGFSNIVVLDGGSTDGTVEAARSLDVMVVLQHGQGKAAAVDTALSLVRTKYVGFIDADGTYDPSDFEKMLAYAEMADMVIGSRFLHDKKDKPFVAGHGFINRLFNRAFNLIYDSSLTDILSGIRICKSSFLKEINLRSKGFGIEAELSAQILSEGGKVVEVPASFRDRIGQAKLRYRDGYHILVTILRLAYEFNPLLYFVPSGIFLFTPGFLLLSYVFVENAFTFNHVFHSGLALAGLGLTIVGIQIIGFGILSFLMKRIEFRQLRAIRKIRMAV